MAQVGDIVRYLDSVGGGTIVRIDGPMAYVDEDGFETPVLLRQCVVVTPVATGAKSKEIKAAPAPALARLQQPAAVAKPEPVEGDTLNVVLAYEPEEIKHLTTTEYEALLVNDSNYSLLATYLTRGTDGDWIARWSGTVEPGMIEPLGHVSRADLVDMDRVCVQYVAFKADRPFRLKSPVAVETALDTTKFFKLHCFHTSAYFDTPVLSIDVTRNDVPSRQLHIDSSRLEQAMVRKADSPRRQSVPSAKRVRQAEGPVEVDLHIHQLLDNLAGLSNSDMLEVQMGEFRRVMEQYMGDKGRRIVFIHGKGEGVLRQAILKELKLKYKNCDVQDASFREYGFGATQVTIR